MNPDTDPIRLELMKHVERAVRPVAASLKRKMRMRRELLAHVTELYGQELGRLGDPHAAVAAARERLGDPQTLCEQLQGTISAGQRWLSEFESWESNKLARGAVRRPRESAIRHATRVALSVGVFGLLLGGLTIAAGRAPDDEAFARLTWGTAVFTAGAFFLVLLLALLRRLAREGRWGLVTMLIASTGLVPFTVARFTDAPVAAAARDLDAMFPWLVLFLVPAIFLGVIVELERARRLLAPWRDLAIDGD